MIEHLNQIIICKKSNWVKPKRIKLKMIKYNRFILEKEKKTSKQILTELEDVQAKKRRRMVVHRRLHRRH